LGNRPSGSQKSSHGHGATRAVAGVDDDLDRSGEADVPGDVIRVFVDDIERPDPALAAGEDAFAGDLVKGLDRLAVERLLAGHHLKPVVLRRIVRARDHDPGRQLAVEDREIEERRGHDTEVGNVAARGNETADEGLGKARRAQPAVPADGDIALAPTDEERTHGPAQDLDRRLVQVLPGDAPDVVLPEDLRVNVHGALLPSRPL